MLAEGRTALLRGAFLYIGAEEYEDAIPQIHEVKLLTIESRRSDTRRTSLSPWRPRNGADLTAIHRREGRPGDPDRCPRQAPSSRQSASSAPSRGGVKMQTSFISD